MSSGISKFNTQTGMKISSNSQYPALGTMSCNCCSGGGSSGTGMPLGFIVMYYSGMPGTGFIADNAGANGYYLDVDGEIWKLCDATTGSTPATGSAWGPVPDLINKFARGIATGILPVVSPENILINVAPITLSVANLPAHNHSVPALSVSLTSSGPSGVDHDHNNFGGTWGFTYWIPNGGTGTNPGGGVGTELINSLPGSPAPVYPGGLGNRTGGVSGTGSTQLANHTHAMSGSTGTGTTGDTGSGTSFTPAAGGINIKPTSQDVLYIIRVV